MHYLTIMNACIHLVLSTEQQRSGHTHTHIRARRKKGTKVVLFPMLLELQLYLIIMDKCPSYRAQRAQTQPEHTHFFVLSCDLP